MSASDSIISGAFSEDCAPCPLRSRCLSKADAVRRNLSIQVESQSPNLIDQMKAKIDSDEGKRIYGRRLGIVELVVEPVETRCFLTSVSRSACTALLFVRIYRNNPTLLNF
jgi:hypothetical protein